MENSSAQNNAGEEIDANLDPQATMENSADDLFVNIAAQVKHIWLETVENILNCNETVQITLLAFLVTLVVATCLYKRQKLAKSAINTLQRCGDTFEADRQLR